MTELDLNQMSRYPFLDQSRDFVRSMSLTLDDMLSPDNSHIQQKAVDRIEEAVDGLEIASGVRRMRREVESDLLCYPVARFLVASIGDGHLIKWFSHHEGERASKFLRDEEMSTVRDVGEEMGLKVLDGPDVDEPDRKKRFMDVKKALHRERTTAELGTIWISFMDFLEARKNITGSNWDLVNQRLVEGKVGIERDSYIRLIQEKVKARVEEGLLSKPSIPDNRSLKEIISRLKSKVEVRRKKYSPTELGKMSITRLPPCMRQILGMSQAGENIPHHARFGLVTFLSGIGMSKEDIFKIFTTAPDFKEDIVRYQVEHITGDSSATNYHTPNCETMKSGGICFNPDGLCDKEWLNSPLYYYKLKGKKKGKPSTSRNNAS